MRDFSEELGELARRVTDANQYLRIDDARQRMSELEEAASRADLWEDPEQGRKVTTELARVREDVTLVDGLAEKLSDAQTLYELAREESDESLEPEIATAAAELASDLDQLELRALFTGEHDER